MYVTITAVPSWCLPVRSPQESSPTPTGTHARLRPPHPAGLRYPNSPRPHYPPKSRKTLSAPFHPQPRGYRQAARRPTPAKPTGPLPCHRHPAGGSPLDPCVWCVSPHTRTPAPTACPSSAPSALRSAPEGAPAFCCAGNHPAATPGTRTQLSRGRAPGPDLRPPPPKARASKHRSLPQPAGGTRPPARRGAAITLRRHDGSPPRPAPAVHESRSRSRPPPAAVREAALGTTLHGRELWPAAPCWMRTPPLHAGARRGCKSERRCGRGGRPGALGCAARAASAGGGRKERI